MVRSKAYLECWLGQTFETDGLQDAITSGTTPDNREQESDALLAAG